jgi:hypothetical protein
LRFGAADVVLGTAITVTPSANSHRHATLLVFDMNVISSGLGARRLAWTSLWLCGPLPRV